MAFIHSNASAAAFERPENNITKAMTMSVEGSPEPSTATLDMNAELEPLLERLAALRKIEETGNVYQRVDAKYEAKRIRAEISVVLRKFAGSPGTVAVKWHDPRLGYLYQRRRTARSTVDRLAIEDQIRRLGGDV